MRKCVQPNCLLSAETISRSGNLSAKRIMWRMFFSENPRPNSADNSSAAVRTIRSPYSARLRPRTSVWMRRPISQQSRTCPELTAWATPRRIAWMSERKSAKSFRAAGAGGFDPADSASSDMRFFAMPKAYPIPARASSGRCQHVLRPPCDRRIPYIPTFANITPRTGPGPVRIARSKSTMISRPRASPAAI